MNRRDFMKLVSAMTAALPLTHGDVLAMMGETREDANLTDPTREMPSEWNSVERGASRAMDTGDFLMLRAAMTCEYFYQQDLNGTVPTVSILGPGGHLSPPLVMPCSLSSGFYQSWNSRDPWAWPRRVREPHRLRLASRVPALVQIDLIETTGIDTGRLTQDLLFAFSDQSERLRRITLFTAGVQR